MPYGPTTPGHLLSLIRSRPVWTRQQLLAVTGMSRTTLFERLDVLFRHRLVYEAGSAGSDGGRPATLLRFDDRERVALVLDLGQTHARIGVADLSGRTRRMTEQQLDIAEPPQLHLRDDAPAPAWTRGRALRSFWFVSDTPSLDAYVFAHSPMPMQVPGVMIDPADLEPV